LLVYLRQSDVIILDITIFIKKNIILMYFF